MITPHLVKTCSRPNGLLLAVQALLILPSCAFGESQLGSPTYCGVISLCRAADALGKPLDIQSLVKPKYVGSKQGSTLGELQRAAHDHGLCTASFERMSFEMLRASPCPVILHVKSQFRDRDYRHWVLFAGVQDGRPLIYDGDGPASMPPFDELAARWDGVGLAVSDAEIDLNVFRRAIFAQWLFYCGLIAFVAGCFVTIHGVPFLPNFHKAVPAAAGQVVALLLVSFTTGALFSCLTDGGFLTHRPAVEAIQDAHLQSFLPKMTASGVASLTAQGDVKIIDARLPADYSAGHVPTSVNIPPDTSDARAQFLLQDFPVTGRIIIYCQSRGCPYSERVARILLRIGYQNIVIFDGGWAEWVAAYGEAADQMR